MILSKPLQTIGL